jgi:hypothetical protein
MHEACEMHVRDEKFIENIVFKTSKEETLT